MYEKTSVMMGKLVDAIRQVATAAEADEAMPEGLRRVVRTRLALMQGEAEHSQREALAIEQVVQRANPLPAAEWWAYAGEAR